MENFRSKSCREGVQRERRVSPCGMQQDLRRSNSSSCDASSYVGRKMKEAGKGGSNNNNSTSSWRSLKDAELQRKKRVAGYKVYTLQGQMKGSFKKGFSWVRNTCTHVVYGGWW